MPYNELIKDFKRIRSYVCNFYVYGFKSREEYDAKSVKSYYNECRRVENWLGNYMKFGKSASGKSIFLSVDSRSVSQNPLYKAFRNKSFTSLDIALHFIILDILVSKDSLTALQISMRVRYNYFDKFKDSNYVDDSTVRKKLKEYVSIGLLKCVKCGKEFLYSRNDCKFNLESMCDVLCFFSEVDPLGVVGSYLLDKFDSLPDYYSFKHHYILHALESEVLHDLLLAIDEHRNAELTLFSSSKILSHHTILPLKIHISTQNGRRYLMAYNMNDKKIALHRLDSIRSVKSLDTEPEYEKYVGYADKCLSNLWGASFGENYSLDYIEMFIRVEAGEDHIPQRLEREKRCGVVEITDKNTYKFSAHVYDAKEMLPWIRTFTGRIISLSCSNPHIAETFNADLAAMCEMYGGTDDVVQ
ncbi:WYL domain-containing protein [Clostridia bacterium]|nr:WYL domain-containing protein [Clostridia bacterium]